MPNDTTPRGLPLPHPDNVAREDAGRIREAIIDIDGALTDIASSVTTSVAALVDSAPATLDTLKELADALGDDPNFATTTAAALGNRVRVDAGQAFSAALKAQGRLNLGVNQGAILASGNLNSITDPGTYFARPGVTNTPDAAHHWHVEVINGSLDGGTYCWQRACYLENLAGSGPTPAECYYRTVAYDGVWKPWVRMAIATQVLPSSCDFNTVTKAGVYYTPGGDCTNTPAFPGTSNWYLTVEQFYDGTSYCKQTATAVGFGASMVWVRGTTAGAWSPWQRVILLDTDSKYPAFDGSKITGIRIGTTILVNGDTAPAGTLVEDGASYNASSYPALFAALVRYSLVGIYNGTPGYIYWPGHKLKANAPVKFTTTGSLPTGITAGTTYYAKSIGANGTDTFQISAAPGGASIAISGTNSACTAINAPFGCANDLSTFNVPNTLGEFIRGWDGGRGVDSYRVIGSFQDHQLQDHAHTYAGLSGNSGIAAGNDYNFFTVTYTSSPVTGNHGAETRPRNVAKLPCIIYA